MAISSIASALNTKLRLSGMSSGLDTDAIVKQLLLADQAKIDKVLQKKQISQWKTDAYRDITASLKTFYNTYFDTLSAKNLRSAGALTCYTASYASSTAADFIGITPGASAKPGTYTITDIKVATSASNRAAGDPAPSPVTADIVTGNTIDAAAVISKDNDNNRFVFTLNGKTVNITLDDGALGDLSALETKLKAEFDKAYGPGKVTVSTADGKLSFKAALSTDVFSVGTASNTGYSEIFGAKPTAGAPLTLTGWNNRFDLKIGDTTHTIELPTTTYSTAGELITALNNAVKDPSKFGASADITFEEKDGKVVYKSSQTVSVSAAKTNTNVALGLAALPDNPLNLSNKINLNEKIKNIDFNDGSSLPVASGYFTINGKQITFDASTMSINDIMKKVNSDSSLNATISYDLTTNSFSIKSNRTGVTSTLDVSGDLMQVLGLECSGKTGTDAEITVNGQKIVRSDNNFSYNGITYDIKKATSDPITVTVAGDTTKAFDTIKEFVTEYNKLIEKLNGKIGEKRYSDYVPLTDEQKSAMSEDQINKWEEKAKSGLLYGDSVISSALSRMRSALYSSVAGAGMNLSSIGITTSSFYQDKGQLVIDETKLKNALANNSEAVVNLFTNSSDVTYFEAMDDQALKNKRYEESGLANRISDIIQDAIRTSTNKDGKKGSLLEKAGMVGDRSEFTNILYKEISDYDKSVTELNRKLTEKETALYKKFTAMESALSKMNSQSSWLTQQFGGGSN
ncbi:flagellar filament capping protein FliD [Ruminiclostridium cellobioparum]|uniref:Flagellar hook-associated protein 2 n=1 Tax=Ruminiclostridium cellobioparum subsp. termitidis CT1112 TaxID=1195236 RepID=S0FJF5_RUMCE|nr:flagellar filament capping protein FliD [Ruminiclostridium cellobioparum]EMS70391.1 Flagellar capping protein [Ruminiclostridium cellobioparum subsp. termitidis CT1112]